VNADQPTATNPLTFAVRWQTLLFIIERNIFDVYVTDTNSALSPRGVRTYGYEQGPPYMFPQMIVRENLVRHVDKMPSTGPARDTLYPAGVGIDSTESGIIEQNLSDLEDPNAI